MTISDAAKLRELQSELNTLSQETPDMAAIGPALKDAVAPVTEKIEELGHRVSGEVREAKAAIGEAADTVGASLADAADEVTTRFSAAADATRDFAAQVEDRYEAFRASTGLSTGALAGIATGALGAVAGVIVAVSRAKQKSQVSKLTLPGGHEIELSPAATKLATRVGKLSRKARRRAEKRIEEAATASAEAAERARKKIAKARKQAKKELHDYSPADQLAALRQAAAPVLNSKALQANVKAGTDWLRDAAEKLQAMSAQLDTKPVKDQAAKAAGSTRVAAHDVAGIPVALRDALVKAGWTPPKPKTSWTRVLGL